MHPAQYRLLRAPEAAERLGLSTSCLAKLRMSGRGPCFCRLGRVVAYAPKDIDDWIAARRRKSTSDPGAANKS